MIHWLSHVANIFQTMRPASAIRAGRLLAELRLLTPEWRHMVKVLVGQFGSGMPLTVAQFLSARLIFSAAFLRHAARLVLVGLTAAGHRL
jgi:hypothetical protein